MLESLQTARDTDHTPMGSLGKDLQLQYRNVSFDVFLHRFEHGRPAAINKDAVREVLLARDFVVVGGFYDIRFPGGGSVEFSAAGLEQPIAFESCAFHIRGFSRELAGFIWEIARAGRMVILPAMEDFVPILVSAEQKEHLPQELREDYEPVVCQSPATLELLLTGGHSAWQRYRDAIMPDQPKHR